MSTLMCERVRARERRCKVSLTGADGVLLGCQSSISCGRIPWRGTGRGPAGPGRSQPAAAHCSDVFVRACPFIRIDERS